MTQKDALVEIDSSDVACDRNDPQALILQPEIPYISLAVIISSLAIGSYFVFEYVRQGLFEYFAGAFVSGIFFLVFSLYLMKRTLKVRTIPLPPALPELPSLLTRHPLYIKYVNLKNEIEKFDSSRREMVHQSIADPLKELIEERLFTILKRKEKYTRFWEKCDLPGLTFQIKELTDSIESEDDEDILQALNRNIEIARETLSGYNKLEKALKLYDLQISTIGQHLENLNTKVHILELDSQTNDNARDLIDDINHDINDIEQALSSMELPEC